MKKLSLKELLESGIVIKNETGYHLVKDGVTVNLGKHNLEALNSYHKIKRQEQKSSELLEESSKNPDEPIKKIGTFSSETLPKTTEEDENKTLDDEIDRHIHSVGCALKSEFLDCYVDGLKVGNHDNPRLSNTYKVKQFPYTLKWRPIKNKSAGSGSPKADGLTVLTRDVFNMLVKRWNFSVARDEAPDLNFIQSGEFVLCIEKRSESDMRKMRATLKNTLMPVTSINTREEQSKMAADEADKVNGGFEYGEKIYKEDQDASINRNAMVKHASGLKQQPISEILSELRIKDDMTMLQMQEIQYAANSLNNVKTIKMPD